MVCSWRKVSLCRVQLPEARFGSPLRRDFGAERPSWLGGMAGDWAQKAFAHPILLPHEGEHVRSGFRVPETPSKAAGPKEPEATQPRIALGRAQGLGRKRLALLS